MIGRAVLPTTSSIISVSSAKRPDRLRIHSEKGTHVTALNSSLARSDANEAMTAFALERVECAFADSAAVVATLEKGRVAAFPNLSFALTEAERDLIRIPWPDHFPKNMGYDSRRRAIHPRGRLPRAKRLAFARLMQRYSEFARMLVSQVAPSYAAHLKVGRTSFRPAEAAGRNKAPLKDDQRLHPDAFLSFPTMGHRILRVFANINLEGEPRVWRVGEPFETFAQRFVDQVAPMNHAKVLALAALRMTKGKRSLYDHYMLELHNLVKTDEAYQTSAPRTELRLPAQSCWMVFTDQALHAAMGGRYALEQTFLVPVEALSQPDTAPLRVLERMTGRKLVA
jgi:3-deoxy-D-manno-octulosonic acid hydroxylase-like protein